MSSVKEGYTKLQLRFIDLSGIILISMGIYLSAEYDFPKENWYIFGVLGLFMVILGSIIYLSSVRRICAKVKE